MITLVGKGYVSLGQTHPVLRGHSVLNIFGLPTEDRQQSNSAW